jgi:thiosulfate/3-mercaptopyruvate sulfurtransferase
MNDVFLVSAPNDANDASPALLSRRGALWTLTGGALAILAGCRRADAAGGDAGGALPRMAPGDLNARLGEVRDGKIDLLHVGPAYLFGKARIPHARHPGEASTAEGYAAIVAELRKLGADREVVFYCGCCPTKNCPNIAPAERAAHEAGLRRASVLDLPTTLKADWSDHGYPVERS